MEDPNQITYFAETDARNRRITFGIKAKDRTRHVYVIGKTGMGKSTMLENMAVQDIRNGNGFAFIDPHGKTADLLLEYVPEERLKDVIYFAPFDMEHPISFNVMEDVGFDKRHLVVSGLMSTFKKIWQDAWSARMEYILGNTLLALLEYPKATLLEVNKMLADKDFRNKVVDNITDSSVKSFWVDEFAKYTDRFASEATPAIQNKIGQFTANPLIRNIIGQPDSSFDLRQVMDERKIVIINLSKGRIGESNANLLGSMLITKIYLAALSRADIPEVELQKLPNFYLYVDEFQSFANDSFADILSEARKYKLNLTIAHQYIEQMSDEVRAAVFGNVGTLASFRVGSYDAEVLEKEFAPIFTREDIVNLGAYQLYLKLMIDGIGSHPFSARTIPPLAKPEQSLVKEIIDNSRKVYTRPRAEVEETIRVMHKAKNANDNGGGGEERGRNNEGRQKPAFNEKNREKVNNFMNGGAGGGQGGNQGRSEARNGGRDNNGGGNGGQNNGGRLNDDRRRDDGSGRDKNNFKKPMLAEFDLISPELENEGDMVSLADLTKKTLRPNDKKEPTVENKNSLKAALAGILGDLKSGESDGEADQKKPAHADLLNVDNDSDQVVVKNGEDRKVADTQTYPKNDNPQNTNKHDPKEVPEEELRKILDI